ncbi:MAG: 6-pyruvoyl tetrahydropterin synthase family protein [Candidatus Neomarinimicrobiota bacterium]
MIVVTKKFRFCAAHQYHNPNWPEEKNVAVFGDDHRIHGHNYDLEVSLTGSVDPNTGFVADLEAIKSLVQERVVDVLDHAQIDKDIPWFKERQPSSENLVLYIWEQLAPYIAEGVQLVRVRLYETPTIYAEYGGKMET